MPDQYGPVSQLRSPRETQSWHYCTAACVLPPHPSTPARSTVEAVRECWKTPTMVRAGARATVLAAVIQMAGAQIASRTPTPPRLGDLREDLAASIMELYRSFGGTGANPALRPGAWDLGLDGGVLVELDEELHFNRYRLAALDSDWARPLPWHEAYVWHCERTEAHCLAAGSWGKRWTSPSCDAMFGVGDPPGQLLSKGAPRWKQRALYDAMKDAYAVSPTGQRIARVSVHDKVSDVTLGDVLEGRASVAPDEVLALIRQRTA